MSGAAAVSLCVIARDEEMGIRQCLRSVAHLVQEAIVVDTGSTDGTAAAAREEGAKVLAFDWKDDFSAARNFALDQAAGEWILVLDADEVLEFVSPPEFGRLLAASGVEGYYLKIRSFRGTGTEAADIVEDHAVRLFRHNRAYRFKGAIHEQIAGSIQAANNGGGLAFAGLTITHFGYLDRQIKAKDKHSRNIRVISQALAAAPEDPLLNYSLGLEYLQSGQYLLAANALAEAMRLLRGDEGYCRNAVMAYGISLYKAGRLSELAELTERYLKVLPADGDFYVLRGIGALSAGKYPEGTAALAAALAQGGELLPQNWLHALFGDAYSLSGDYQRAGEEYLQALRLNPYALYPFLQVLGLKKRGRINVDWLTFSRLGLPAGLEKSREDGEALADLALLLLKILAWYSEGLYAPLPILCQRGERILSAIRERERDQIAIGIIAGYLEAVLAEVRAYAEAAARFGCGLFQPPSLAISDLIIASLEAAIAVLGPAWTPEPDSCLKGI